MTSREPMRKVDSSRKKSGPTDIASVKKGSSPTSSNIKISVKSGKAPGVQSLHAEKSAPGSPIVSTSWKVSSLANYKIGGSANPITSPRHSTGGIQEDYKLPAKSGISVKTGRPTGSSPPSSDAGKVSRGSRSIKGTK